VRGVFTPAAVQTPAAGVDINFVPVRDACWLLNSLTATLTTSATAGTRQVVLQVLMLDGETIYSKAVVATQAASLTYTYCFARRAGMAADTSALIGTTVSDGVPDFQLPNYAVVRTVSALLAGDQWSGVFATYEVWPTTAEGEQWEQRPKVSQAVPVLETPGHPL